MKCGENLPTDAPSASDQEYRIICCFSPRQIETFHEHPRRFASDRKFFSLWIAVDMWTTRLAVGDLARSDAEEMR